ncbi:PLP-dependent aminotransferase family protein [Corticibacter populi]|uniref:PLP-dependent aminotransferase family protein n=1 Tax=Corticibacter populi TaxID=1550736 RepID=A0A3M6QZU9_9BURK|nr:PLP-dependent aminotransferase family protein [Corticibacter populi]RMX08556.1 PLP-dependent aminotransferase family protein [Corticibacter populi]RZS35876.1 DNA-binding transcriptional MocR family regulator [Corticibacter populi]
MQFAKRLQNVETSAIREIFKLLGTPGIISFAGGFPDAALFDREGLAEAARKAVLEQPAASLQYGPTEGYQPLREQITSRLHEQGAQVAPADVLVTTGSQQALDLLGKTLLSPGDKVLVEGPTFLATIQCFRLYGAEVISVPTDGDGVQVDALERLIAEHRPRLVYLIPTFGNPSGSLLPLARRRRVLELAAQHRVVVVEDNPYGELYFDELPPATLLALSATVPGSRDWLVYCGSFSKILSPGLRLGWMVAPAALLANAVMCKQFSDANSSMLAQVTASEYLQTGRLAATLTNVQQVYAERARLMMERLRAELGEALAFTPPRGGMFIWARLTGAGGRSGDAAAFVRRGIEQGVAVVPGLPFYATEPDPATFRMSYATVPDEKIIEGVQRLARAL